MDSSFDLLIFFKALADETRLKMVGLLAREAHSGEALATLLEVKPATISHHLAKLAEAGLVSASMDGHSKLYELRLDVIHAMAGKLLAEETLPQVTQDVDAQAFDRKVVRDFTRRDGSLKEIPAAQKKLLAVLRHVAHAFQPGQIYTEKHVNLKLARFHADTASLRRHLISYKLLVRDTNGARYWRSE